MTGAVAGSVIAAEFERACRLEVAALKPGNVHRFAAGHGMTIVDFEASAAAAAPFIANASLGTGARVLGGVRATFAAVGCNTNLGILLLCAPLAVAAQREGGPPASLHTRLIQVLASFTTADVEDVFAAIAAASPGGLGEHTTSDVRHAPPPGMTLIHAMELAASRDLIAAEYVSGFARIFSWAETHYAPRLAAGWSQPDALARTFLYALARVPDSHIARKHGPEVAETVRQQAFLLEANYFANAQTRPSAGAAHQALLAFDSDLKARSINPGSLADLMAAMAFSHGLAAQMATV